MWEVDPLIATYSKEDCEVLGIEDAPYKHDASGARIQATTTTKPSPELQVKILEQLKSYRKQAQLDVHVTGGVLHLNKPATEQIELQQIPFVGDVDSEQKEEATNYLAVAKPPDTTEEFDALASAGAFDHRPATFHRLDGTSVVRHANDDRLAVKPTDRPDIAAEKLKAQELRDTNRGVGADPPPAASLPNRQQAEEKQQGQPGWCPPGAYKPAPRNPEAPLNSY